jgi:hypothetical protein
VRPTRRLVCAALASAAAAPALADEIPKDGFEGEWGGAVGQRSAQVIVTSGEVIGFYWGNDYTDTSNAKFSADGRVLSFDFAAGHATLTRTGATTATLEVRAGDKTQQAPLKRD